jgi:hypothetical protein
MPDATIPEKAVLEELTTQKLAWEKDVRAALEAVGSTDSLDLLAAADGVAGLLRAQFPGGCPLGRMVMALAQALATAAEVYEIDSLNVLLSVAGLAAEQLEREGAEHA